MRYPLGRAKRQPFAVLRINKLPHSKSSLREPKHHLGKSPLRG